VTDRLLTAREVAEHLGFAPKTILRWRRRGLLPAIELPGGKVRFRPEDVDAWLDERATGAAERGVLATRTDRAHDGAYVEVPFASLATRPPDAAENEEEDHAC
jgi:excisionase family DNA binding protein